MLSVCVGAQESAYDAIHRTHQRPSMRGSYLAEHLNLLFFKPHALRDGYTRRQLPRQGVAIGIQFVQPHRHPVALEVLTRKEGEA